MSTERFSFNPKRRNGFIEVIDTKLSRVVKRFKTTTKAAEMVVTLNNAVEYAERNNIDVDKLLKGGV